MQFLNPYIYAWIISHSKYSNWHWISKLSSNFGCLFTLCYSARANSIKTKLQTCNLQTGQSIRNKYVNQFWLNLLHPNRKHPRFDNNFDIWPQLENFEYEMIHALARMAPFFVSSSLLHFKKHPNFLWTCSFLSKNRPNFVCRFVYPKIIFILFSVWLEQYLTCYLMSLLLIRT